MKNVKVIFTDTDYELVTKAYKQYDKLEKDYYDKYALFGVSALVTVLICPLIICPLMFTFAQCISNTIFAGLIVIACTIVLKQTLAYDKKNRHSPQIQNRLLQYKMQYRRFHNTR